MSKILWSWVDEDGGTPPEPDKCECDDSEYKLVVEEAQAEIQCKACGLPHPYFVYNPEDIWVEVDVDVEISGGYFDPYSGEYMIDTIIEVKT